MSPVALILLQINGLCTNGREDQAVVCDSYSPLVKVACEYFSFILTLIYMGYFDCQCYIGEGAKMPPHGLTLALDFRQT